jgi:hypothetical protein
MYFLPISPLEILWQLQVSCYPNTTELTEKRVCDLTYFFLCQIERLYAADFASAVYNLSKVEYAHVKFDDDVLQSFLEPGLTHKT